MVMHAEQAYVFRHAIVREAAYQLQLPGARAQLHALAADALEALYGAPTECSIDLDSFAPSVADPFAEEICAHLQAALIVKTAPARKAKLRARQARHLRRAAHYCVEQFRYTDAADRFERLATELSAHVEDPCAELIKAADAAARAFQIQRGLRLCRRAVHVARRARDRVRVGRALAALGRHVHRAGRSRRAIKLLDGALAILREQRDEEGLMVATSSRGALALDREDFARAQPLLTEALQLARKHRHVRREGTGLNNLAALHIEMSNPDKALEILDTALDFNRRHGNLRALGFTWTNIGSVHNGAGRDAQAQAALAEALAIHKQIANFQHAGYAANMLGRICERGARPLEARRHWLEAAGHFAACGNAKFEGGTRCDAAIVLLAHGDVAEAEREFTRGMELIRQDPDPGLVERMTAKFEKALAAA
ncbi:hypothetical protein PLCT2_02471 [Planctomycetaceae bacterium]|nr:hypothetical protein PLCT2_02471 [Planctomycetaceae bacterium]